MILVTAILGVVSAALTAVIVAKLFKDANKEEKLDKIATVVQAGVQAAITALEDGAQAQDIVTIIQAMVNKVNEL